VVVLIRPIAFFASLVGSGLDFHSRFLIAWFGPRGLSSLLLILVPVFAAIPQGEHLFFICCFVVLLSVALHGSSLMLLKRERHPAEAPAVAARSVTELLQSSPGETGVEHGAASALSTSAARADESKLGDLISVTEMREIQQSGIPTVVLDVRAERNFANSELRAQGALRVPPDRAVERLKELDVPLQTWLVAFCA
jgi:hypothetical protein